MLYVFSKGSFLFNIQTRAYRYRPRVKVGPCSVIHITADAIDERLYSWSSLLKLGNTVLQDIKRQWSRQVH